MNILLELYKLKVKLFLGSFKASKAGIGLLLLYVLGMIPSIAGLSMVVVNLIKAGVNLGSYINVLSALISGFLALDLFLTLRGFTAFDYEQSFIFSSPVTPRIFLVAGMLAEITIYSLSFFSPAFIFLFVIVTLLHLSVMTLFLTVIVLISFIFFLFFLENSLAIIESSYKDLRIKLATISVIAVLLLPSINFLIRFPVNYNGLPYPSSFFAEILLNALQDRLPPIAAVSGFLLYFLTSLGFFIFSSSRNIFQYANTIPFVSPFDTSMKMQTVKMGKNIRLFSRVKLGMNLNLRSESLLRFLMKKELIRMMRDGSLFGVMMLYLIISIMNIVGSSGGIPIPVWLFLLAIYSLIVPAMLIGNWRIGELGNLWIPLTSSTDLGCFIKALLFDLILIAFIVPAGTILILTLFSLTNPLIPLILITSVSLIGCSANLFTVLHFLEKGRRAISSLIVSWASMLLSGLLISPIYGYVTLSLYLNLDLRTNILLGSLILIYSVLVFRFLSRKLEKKALKIEV